VITQVEIDEFFGAVAECSEVVTGALRDLTLIAEGVPGLPDQLDRFTAYTDRFYRALVHLEKLVERLKG
jgi:hypothetical protein